MTKKEERCSKQGEKIARIIQTVIRKKRPNTSMFVLISQTVFEIQRLKYLKNNPLP